MTGPISSFCSVEELAEELLTDAKFRALKLGTWLGATDGQLLLAAVEALAPPPHRQDIKLLATALELAATKQHDAARQTLAKGILLTLGAAAVAAALRGNGTK